MYFCKGRFCSLEELCDNNIQNLYILLGDNKEDYTFFVDSNYSHETYELFLKRVQKWFLKGRSFQFLVRNLSGSFVGTIFFYNLNTELNSVKISCFFGKDYHKKLFVAESLGLSLIFARNILNINNLTFSVYGTNENMLSFIKKLGFCIVSEKEEKTDRFDFLISNKNLNKISHILSKLRRNS